VLKKPEYSPEAAVACEVCLKEIPRSVASSEEGSEYVYYFCGEACFDKWQQGQNEAGKPGQ